MFNRFKKIIPTNFKNLTHDFKNRTNDLLNRTNELLNGTNDFLSRLNDLKNVQTIYKIVQTKNIDFFSANMRWHLYAAVSFGLFDGQQCILLNFDFLYFGKIKLLSF